MKTWLKFGCGILLAGLLILCGLYFHKQTGDLLPEDPKTGVWYRVAAEGAVNADGSPWQGKIRLGTENRLLVYFLGGGLSLDAHSAARSASAAGAEAFYYDRDDGLSDRRASGGITGMDERNPFRNWTVILIPYTTGDFHVGAGEAPYVSLKGEDARIHHNGYRNYAALMDAVRHLAGEPDALLIAGYSAGGFGAAMLAEDVISRFPDTENITLCVDGALLMNENWRDVAVNRWHAPEWIADRMVSDNLTLDHLAALHEKYGDGVKILFTCSARDGDLAKFQAYIDGKPYAATAAHGDAFEENLRRMAGDMREVIPGAGLYIWNGIPYAGDAGLTKHTILTSDALFEGMAGEESIADWILAAVEGRIESRGLHLLEAGAK